MKRFLYVLLAVALAGSAPGSVFRDPGDADGGDDDTPDAVLDAAARRPGLPLAGAGLRLAPRQAQPEELVLRLPVGAAARGSHTASILVERRRPEVAEIRTPESSSPPDPIALGRLLDVALRDCRAQGDLKVVVDLPVRADALPTVCRRHGFILARSRRRGARLVHDLYADLYSKRQPREPSWSPSASV